MSSVSETKFQQLWLKVLCNKFKSFLLCAVYRPLDAPINFLENLSETFVDFLLRGLNVLILGDLNCNLFGDDPDGLALSEFCSTFCLSELVKIKTTVTEKSNSLIDVALTTNESIVHATDVMGHVAALLTVKANWFDTLTVKQWEIMINNDVLLVSATNEETPY